MKNNTISIVIGSFGGFRCQRLRHAFLRWIARSAHSQTNCVL